MASKLKSFDLEFKPFIDEMNAKVGDIREFAGVVTMDRVKGKCNSFYNQNTILLVCVGYQQAANAAETGWLRIGGVDETFYLVSFVFDFRWGAG